MTKHLLLALALTLGTAAIATPRASACGGYGSIESPDQRAIREAVLAMTQPRYGASGQVSVSNIEVNGERARATVLFVDGDRFETRGVTLRRRAGTWRILSFV